MRDFLCPLLLAYCTTIVQVADGQKCYDAHGIETENLPCNPAAAVSPCCAPTFVCLDNGLCQPGPNTTAAGYQTLSPFYRGSCTDSTWKDRRCPQFCDGSDDNQDGQGVESCDGDSTGLFCCSRSDHDCCKNSTEIFSLGAANIQTTIGYVPPFSTSATTSAASISSSSSSSLVASPSQSASTSMLPSPSSSNNNAVKIGAGVGVGFGIPLLLGIALGVVLWRRKHRAATGGNSSLIRADNELDTTSHEERKGPLGLGPEEMFELHAHDAGQHRMHELR
ncbi:hypothetical protein BDV96DRAFT_308336 [Lophiotrema nucula]|uniref:Mid2 domain-containing protein n=1 Tax=Lophiotrema nucula TaxID=690887 RepID=A0A6A5YIX1_9PLEO|nr:hypothetical protein BDV96DRAFT_308336 [Lophiotrema nucula]